MASTGFFDTDIYSQSDKFAGYLTSIAPNDGEEVSRQVCSCKVACCDKSCHSLLPRTRRKTTQLQLLLAKLLFPLVHERCTREKMMRWL